MKEVSKPIDSDRLVDYDLGQLSAAERAEIDRALADSPELRRRLEMERSINRGLGRRLERVSAPPGLETRIRAALRAEGAAAEPSAQPGRASVRWFLRPQFLGLAALLLLAVALVQGVQGWISRPQNLQATRVLVVDEACDRKGVGLNAQRSCPAPDHLNALKPEGGSTYWRVAANETGRRILADRALRGHHIAVHGALHRRLETVEVDRFEDLGAASLVTQARATGRYAMAGPGYLP